MFNWFYKILGTILSFIDSVTGNYLITIILFGILFKLVLIPLYIKQQKNTVKQASLRPKEMAIRKRYKGRTDQNSQNEMNMKIQEMYKAEGYSAFGGCLPLLVQLPIVWAMYRVIRQPLTYVCKLGSDALEGVANLTGVTNGDELTMVAKLRGMDAADYSQWYTGRLPKFDLFGIDLSKTPLPEITSGGKGLLYLLIPVLTFAIMFGSTKITRKFTYQPQQDASMGCSMKIMDLTMPLMSTYISAIWPSIMGVYWMFNNLLNVVQQFVLYKLFPMPVFTEEDYKNAERQMRGKAPKYATPASDPRVVEGKQYRSLHHIDDDDEEPIPKLPPMKIDLDEDEQPPEGAPVLKEDKPDHKKKK